LRSLYPRTGKSLNIGITGAPGSGKSTLVDRLATHYRDSNRRVGIIAVDPTSPYSGGAILGDRIRMKSRSTDEGTFIRSMATRGNLGGIARATVDAMLVLDAAGFDTILVETVGVGQDEVDVVKAAAVTLVLLVPGMGDDVQTMKAGIMEVGDVFVVNKSDLPAADRVEAEVGALLSISNREDGWEPRIVKTIASEGKGIAECAAAIDDYMRYVQSHSLKRPRDIRIHEERVLDIARHAILKEILSQPGASGALRSLAARVADREIDPYEAAEELLRSRGARNKE
jgi:LAO/AO transport system kinase